MDFCIKRITRARGECGLLFSPGIMEARDECCDFPLCSTRCAERSFFEVASSFPPYFDSAFARPSASFTAAEALTMRVARIRDHVDSVLIHVFLRGRFDTSENGKDCQ